MKNLSGNASGWLNNEEPTIMKEDNNKKNKKLSIANELKTLKKTYDVLYKKYISNTNKNLNDALTDLSDAIRCLDNLN